MNLLYATIYFVSPMGKLMCQKNKNLVGPPLRANKYRNRIGYGNIINKIVNGIL